MAILLWSATFALARSLSERIGAIAAGAAVYLVGGAILWLLRALAVRDLKQKPPRPLYLYGCGFLFVLYTVLLYLAVGFAQNRQQLLEIALLNYLWPSLTVLLSIPLLKKHARPLLLPATALAMAGIFLVMTPDATVSWRSFWLHFQQNPVGYSVALLAAVSWGFYSNLARRWSTPDATGGVEWFTPAAGLILLGLTLVQQEAVRWTWPAVIEALLLGTITGLAYSLWDRSMRKGNLLFVAACSYFTPLLSTLVSCLVPARPARPEALDRLRPAHRRLPHLLALRLRHPALSPILTCYRRSSPAPSRGVQHRLLAIAYRSGPAHPASSPSAA